MLAAVAMFKILIVPYKIDFLIKYFLMPVPLRYLRLRTSHTSVVSEGEININNYRK